MEEQSRHYGPIKGVHSIIQRIITIVISILETRLQLVIIELEEAKATLIKLLIISVCSLLLMMLAISSLLTLIFYSIDPAWGLVAISVTSVTSFLLSSIGLIWISIKIRRFRLLDSTTEQLAIDRALLEKNQ